MTNTKTGADDAAAQQSTAGVSRRQRRYEQLLATVTKQTGGPTEPQRASIARPRVHLHMVSHGRFDREGVQQSIRAARENGAILQFQRDGGPPRLLRATRGGCRAVIAAENQRADPDVALQERLAAILKNEDYG